MCGLPDVWIARCESVTLYCKLASGEMESEGSHYGLFDGHVLAASRYQNDTFQSFS